MAGTHRLIGKLKRILASKNLLVATAESCTGGLLAKYLTDFPGASKYYAGGVVSYANAAKISLLGVGKANLRKHGAVSRQVAGQMARNIRRKLKASLAVSITGIAGPGGGSIHKPVGLVYIGVSDSQKTKVHRFIFRGSRAAVREQSVQKAAGLLLTWASRR